MKRKKPLNIIQIFDRANQINDLYNEGIEYLRDSQYNKALDIFLEIEEYNRGDVFCALGYMYEKGNSPEGICYDTALYYYLRAIECNFIQAQYRIGKMYIEGRGVELDHKYGIKLIEAAANLAEENSIAYLKVINGKFALPKEKKCDNNEITVTSLDYVTEKTNPIKRSFAPEDESFVDKVRANTSGKKHKVR